MMMNSYAVTFASFGYLEMTDDEHVSSGAWDIYCSLHNLLVVKSKTAAKLQKIHLCSR